MSEEQQNTIELEDSSDDKIVVVDPDNYRNTKKLQSIHKAKEHYKTLARNRIDRETEIKDAWANYQKVVKKEVAEAVADYIAELVPLIEEGIDRGVLEDEDLMVPVYTQEERTDITHLAAKGGKVLDDGEVRPIHAVTAREVYIQGERIERKLGLGLDLEEEKGPASI